MIPFGNQHEPQEQRSRFHEACKRLFEKRCHYTSDAKDFLKSFHAHYPEPVRPTYRAPLRGVVRRAD